MSNGPCEDTVVAKSRFVDQKRGRNVARRLLDIGSVEAEDLIKTSRL